MRKTDSVIIRKAIIHVLDRHSDEPILADNCLEIDENIHGFLENHIIRSLSSQENRKGKFRSGNSVVKNACITMLKQEENFVETSKEIAKQLFKAMKINQNISSADLVICHYASKYQNYIAILKLDYKTSFVHRIEIEDDRLTTAIIPQSIGLPGMGHKLQQCAFVKEIDEKDEYDLIVLDKQEIQDDDFVQYFTNSFLNCQVLIDSRDKTKIFKKVTENMARKNFKEDIEKALEIREEMIETLKNGAVVDVEKFSQGIFGNDVDMQQKFVQNLEREGLHLESFDIDKPWVQKKMKKRVMKTDTGMEIKGDFEDYDDRMKFEMIRNGDGTVNILIKNVRRIIER